MAIGLVPSYLDPFFISFLPPKLYPIALSPFYSYACLLSIPPNCILSLSPFYSYTGLLSIFLLARVSPRLRQVSETGRITAQLYFGLALHHQFRLFKSAVRI